MEIEEKEELTLKDKVMKGVIAFFLSILLITLIITLIPSGEAEQNFLNVLTGQDVNSAGKIGDENISIDYFTAARKDCYNRHKETSPNIDEETIYSCAYETIRKLKVSNILAESTGFGISEQKIKQGIWEQAVDIFKRSSTGAGYSDEEKTTAEQMYKNILHSSPMRYRQDMYTAYSIDRLLFSNTSSSDEEKKIASESEGLKINLKYLLVSDLELLNKIGDELPVSEDEMRKDYDESMKSGNLKNSKGEVPSFEDRKTILLNKIRSEKKKAKLAEIKKNLETLKGADKINVLAEIQKITGGKIENLASVSLAELNHLTSKQSNSPIRFVNNSGFLKDLTEIPFGKGKVGGPYPEGDMTVYVEFVDMKIEAPKVIENSNSSEKDKLKSYIFLAEIERSLNGIYPIYRTVVKRSN